jgi:hypothetical protein
VRAGVLARANVRIDQIDARTGRLLSRGRRHNLVVDAGLDLLRDLVYGDAAVPSHGAVGTDNTAPAAGDVALGAEVFRDQISQRTKQAAGLVIKFVVGSQQANGLTLREAGLFNAASSGIMYARATPDQVVKSDAILVIYTWTLSFAAVTP